MPVTPVTPVTPPSFCVAGVALGDMDLRFAWQAWHLVTWTFVLHGRRGTSATGLVHVTLVTPVTPVTPQSFCVAGVALNWRHGACIACSTTQTDLLSAVTSLAGDAGGRGLACSRPTLGFSLKPYNDGKLTHLGGRMPMVGEREAICNTLAASSGRLSKCTTSCSRRCFVFLSRSVSCTAVCLCAEEADVMCVGCETAVGGLFPFSLCSLVFVSLCAHLPVPSRDQPDVFCHLVGRWRGLVCLGPTLGFRPSMTARAG